MLTAKVHPHTPVQFLVGELRSHKTCGKKKKKRKKRKRKKKQQNILRQDFKDILGSFGLYSSIFQTVANIIGSDNLSLYNVYNLGPKHLWAV